MATLLAAASSNHRRTTNTTGANAQAEASGGDLHTELVAQPEASRHERPNNLTTKTRAIEVRTKCLAKAALRHERDNDARDISRNNACNEATAARGTTKRDDHEDDTNRNTCASKRAPFQTHESRNNHH